MTVSPTGRHNVGARKTNRHRRSGLPRARPSLGTTVSPVQRLPQEPYVYERSEQCGAAIWIDAAKSSGVVGRYVRPRHFDEYRAQPLKFVAGSRSY